MGQYLLFTNGIIALGYDLDGNLFSLHLGIDE